MHMHRSLSRTMTATLLAGVLACGGGGDETGAGATEGSSGGAGSTSGSESTASPTNDPTTTGMSQSGTDTSTSGSSESGPTSEPDPTTGGESDTGPATVPDTDPDTGFTETTVDPDTGESTGAPSLCPPEPNDDDCQICTKGRCCDELLACQADEVCGCFSMCIAMGGNPMECGMQCMANPMMNEALMALRQCNQTQCEEACMMP